MNFKFFVYSLLFCVSLFSFSSCSDEISGEGEDVKYKIEDITVRALNNEGIFPTELEGDSANGRAFLIEVGFDKEEQMQSNGRVHPVKIEFLDDKITSIEVQDKQDFSSEIKKDTDLASEISIIGYDLKNLTEFDSDIFPPKALLLGFKAFPKVGMHEFEVRVKFESGKELVKSIIIEIQ